CDRTVLRNINNLVPQGDRSVGKGVYIVSSMGQKGESRFAGRCGFFLCRRSAGGPEGEGSGFLISWIAPGMPARLVPGGYSGRHPAGRTCHKNQGRDDGPAGT